MTHIHRLSDRRHERQEPERTQRHDYDVIITLAFFAIIAVLFVGVVVYGPGLVEDAARPTARFISEQAPNLQPQHPYLND